MRIVCPSCASVYQVPDSALAPGTLVECVRCHNQWAPIVDFAPEPLSGLAPVHELAAEPAHSGTGWGEMPMPDPARDPVTPRLNVPRRESVPQDATAARSGVAVIAAWAASIAVIACVAWLGFAYRDSIMHGWPPSTRLYVALGLGPPAR